MAWAKNGTSNTLGSAGDVLEITDLTAKQFNQFMSNVLIEGSSTTLTANYTFDNDANSVYSSRSSYNGASDGTVTADTNSGTIFQTLDTAGEVAFQILYTCAIVGEEKLSICFNVDNDAGTSATVAPNRREIVFKYVPSPDATITSIEFDNIGTGNYATDSNLSAIGTD